MEKYIGKSVYKGTAIGPVSVLKKKDSLVKRIHIDNTAEELKRLDAAKERTMTQLGQLYEKALQGRRSQCSYFRGASDDARG